MEKRVTHKASRKKGLLDQRDDFSFNKFSQLEGRSVLRDSDNAILRPLRGKSGASSQDHPALLSSQFHQRVGIFTAVVNNIVTQHPQFLSQLSKHSVRDKLHCLKLMGHALAKNPNNRSRPG